MADISDCFEDIRPNAAKEARKGSSQPRGYALSDFPEGDHVRLYLAMRPSKAILIREGRVLPPLAERFSRPVVHLAVYFFGRIVPHPQGYHAARNGYGDLIRGNLLLKAQDPCGHFFFIDTISYATRCTDPARYHDHMRKNRHTVDVEDAWSF